MRKEVYFIVAFWGTFVFMLATGWVMNIIKIFELMGSDSITPELVIRAIGVFVVPFGAVAGYF